MSFETLRIIAAVILLLCAAVNLVRRHWVLNVAVLALQYVCVFLIILEVRTPLLAAIKLIVGLMVSLMVYLILRTSGLIDSLFSRQRLTSGEVFRGTIALLLVLISHLAAPKVKLSIFPQSSELLLTASMGLMLFGLFQMGTITEPLYLVIGMLTFLSGFELLYASLEFSRVLEAFFTAINLLLALVGSFFIVKDVESRAG
ncbi:MAG: hypothetical protein KBA05_01875 [Anaerolineaceae bacterium]|jgi:hypothetical protein|nr:hypothetical protein [Anaerolineaceae bacterium]MDI9531566.1 hypothetical protein [Chloroflexota bacterium]NLE92865.1 hypothetical protein [Chloroflexota bacterium]